MKKKTVHRRRTGLGVREGGRQTYSILRESTVPTVCVRIQYPKRASVESRAESKRQREMERASDREMGRHGGRGRVHLLCDSDGERRAE